MTREEAQTYWYPTRSRHFSNNLEGSQELAQLLGVPYPHGEYCEQLFLTEELKTALLALNGPHGATVLKVYQIQKGMK